jgi:hypothetical protein
LSPAFVPGFSLSGGGWAVVEGAHSPGKRLWSAWRAGTRRRRPSGPLGVVAAGSSVAPQAAVRAPVVVGVVRLMGASRSLSPGAPRSLAGWGLRPAPARACAPRFSPGSALVLAELCSRPPGPTRRLATSSHRRLAPVDQHSLERLRVAPLCPRQLLEGSVWNESARELRERSRCHRVAGGARACG